jgi:hypothetical protein
MNTSRCQGQGFISGTLSKRGLRQKSRYINANILDSIDFPSHILYAAQAISILEVSDGRNNGELGKEEGKSIQGFA